MYLQFGQTLISIKIGNLNRNQKINKNGRENNNRDGDENNDKRKIR